MAEEKYPIPENPQYNPDIRKLLDSDPARASTVFNPVLQQMIENTAAVKKQADETKEKVAQSAELGAGGITLGDGTTVEQAVNDLRAGKADLDPQTGKVRADLLPAMDYVPAAQKGAAGGVAELDSAGKVPAAQLPSFVDDVLEYANLAAFPATGEAGKIYVTQDTNKTYRWSGSGYVEISQGVALGETSATAYRGDRGKVAYEHSQKTGNPHGATAAQIPYTDNKGLGSTNLQGAMDVAAQASKDAQRTADAALEAITKLAHTIDATPSQNGSLTFTGSEQSPSWNSYNPETLVLGGAVKGTDAGTYTATFTPVEGYTWSDGSNTARSVTWSIGKATIADVPSQSGTLTYTGNALSPAWSNYDTVKMTLGGATSGTNAGGYNATFTPTANYQWPDGSTAAKTVVWNIGKAAGSLTLNKITMELTHGAQTGTITVTRTGDGAVSATSSNTGVATVSVSGTTVTVTGKAYGTVTITVIVAAGSNYNAPANKTCNVVVKLYSNSLNNTTWAQIREASDSGIAASIWSVGLSKNIKINGTVGNATFSNLSIDVFVIGFNHNSVREGSNRIHFQIGKIDRKLTALCDNQYSSGQSGNGYFNMNPNNSNSGGWKDSRMRNNILGSPNSPNQPIPNSLVSCLPADLRAVMKGTNKFSDNTGGASDTASYVTNTTDYLFLLSEFEYHGARSYANSAEKNYQAQYDYYKAGNSKVHYKHNSTGATAYVWCRSVNATGSNGFCLVYASGSAYSNSANIPYGVAPGFCV